MATIITGELQLLHRGELVTIRNTSGQTSVEKIKKEWRRTYGAVIFSDSCEIKYTVFYPVDENGRIIKAGYRKK